MPEPKPRKAPRQERSKQTVDAILEGCARLLREGDYGAVTTNHIAERAGVSIGSVYEFFPNKEAIVKRYLPRQRQLAQEALARLAEEDNPDPDATEEAHYCRRHPQLLEEGRQAKTDLPVKMDVDPTFQLARFVGCLDCGRGGARREINRHF